ncbi:MAG: metallophosphoesterase [Polyangiaceae bacterium]
MSVDVALRVAREIAAGRPLSPSRTRVRATRRAAVGDPQASLEKFFEVLHENELLGNDGFLGPEVQLVSAGDHFDFGPGRERRTARESGFALLSWLRAHSPAQVVLLAGNHDLGRVGELASYEDESFDALAEAAIAAYRDGDVDPELERALLDRHPALPSAELAARDYSAYSTAQRELVWTLLTERRLRLAHADSGLLFCHAGVTQRHLTAIGLPEGKMRDAVAVAGALNAALDAAVARGRAVPFTIPGLHRPGDRAHGEGGGILYHRPQNPELPSGAEHDVTDLLGRRFDPRGLPLGLTQVIGHVGDAKCRELLGPWAQGEPAAGALRHLRTDGARVRYARGVPDAHGDAGEATLIFIDGQMHGTAADRYELFEW